MREKRWVVGDWKNLKNIREIESLIGFLNSINLSQILGTKIDDMGEKISHGLVTGIDIVYMSDMLPAHQGSGLGASSAILVGTLNALHAYKGEHVSAETLAQEACKIEVDILGHPIGKQDQYASSYGGLNYIQFNSDESVTVDPLIFKKNIKEELNNNMILFYTGLNTRSDTILNEQKKKTKNNFQRVEEGHRHRRLLLRP